MHDMYENSESEVERVLPYARFHARRWTRAYGGAGIKPTDKKVLIAVDNKQDPVVIEAYKRAILEMGPKVDVVTYYKLPPEQEWEAHFEVTVDPERYYAWCCPFNLMDIGKDYDVIIETGAGGMYPIPKARRVWHCFVSREMMTSPAAIYPQKIIDAIDLKTRALVKKFKKVRITDPEGTDIRYTLLDEYGWEKVDSLTGHHSVYPHYCKNSDAEGVMASTMNHIGPHPHMLFEIEKGKIVKVKGGGKYGEALQQKFEEMKDKVYPNVLPGPGINYWSGCPVGTHPKIARPNIHDFFNLTLAGGLWERRRAGLYHVDFGPHGGEAKSKEDVYRLLSEGRPLRHYHMHWYFATTEAETKDGETIIFTDKGHLTVLDDPEVRKVAAEYGDPDKLLKEDWIPPVPGISVPGNYEEYARDPVSWIKSNP
jgi:hypothetical protein